MSELKAFNMPRYAGVFTKHEVYLKSEADKVIAELKHQRDGAFGLTNLGLTLDDLTKMARKEIDRQKYKRCLAMARWCIDVRELMHKLPVTDVEADRRRMKKCKWCRKWRNRWLELAKQFKPNSTAQQG